jgi:hypothetical protein
MAAFDQVREEFDISEDILTVPINDEGYCDSVDRIQLGADLLRALVAAGC